ncbi:hypothetical protein SNE40_016102 [Patella caerulea]|uniref:Uncharacterized protein n=1 Tax=Patella caerulea TaxID=87958 RepID=A0AAN8JCJ1_PATCE
MFVFLLALSGSISGCLSGEIQSVRESEDGIPEFQLNQSLSSFSTLNISNDKSIQVLYFDKSTSRCELNQLQFPTPDLLCNVSSDTITLRIGNVIVSNEDIANYTCTNNTHVIEGCWQYLVVLEKAKILGMKPDFNPLEVFEGSDVSLFCEADQSVYPVITNFVWIKDGEIIPSEVNETYKLTNVSTNSSGTYECTASNSIGSSLKVQKKLSVLVWPTIVPQFYEITSTGNTKLICNVTGTVYWRKVGSSDVLCYDDLTCDVSIQESTYYECFSETTHISSFGSRVTKITSATFHVIYQYKPELQNIHENPIQLTGRLGHPFETKLAFKANPNATFSISNTKVTLRPSEVQANVFKISSDGLTEADFGYHACQATNVQGSTNLFLWLKGHPEPPVNLTYQMIEPNLVALSWEPGFGGGTSQMFHVKMSIDGSDWQRYNCSGTSITAPYCNVTGLAVDVVHLFVVTSLNGYGLVSQESNTLIVLIKSKGHPEPPVNLTYQMIEPNLVALSWEPGFGGGTSQIFQVKMSIDGSDWQRYNCSGTNITAPYCNVTDLAVDVVHLFVVTSLNDYGLVSQESNTLIVLIKSKDKGTTSTGIIVGSVCSSILLIIVIILCVMYRPWRNICNSEPDNNEPDRNIYEQPESKRSCGSMFIRILENIRNKCKKDGGAVDNESYDTAKGRTEQENYDTLDVRNENHYINMQNKTTDNAKKSDDNPIYENMEKSSQKKKTKQRTPPKTTELDLSVTESKYIYENMKKLSPKRKTRQGSQTKTTEVELSVTESKDIYENMNKSGPKGKTKQRTWSKTTEAK